jgi:hypothetical protein
MNSLSVSENIRINEENIQKLLFQKQEIEKELLRLEGSLRVFKNLQQLNLETIDLNIKPDFELENTEVIDDVIPTGNNTNKK